MASSGAKEADILYDDEAAQIAFFNAPKVTVRNNRRQKGKTKEVDEEEEPEPVAENYDESIDKELNERIAQHLKDFFAKKVTAKNAFETPILDKLPAVAEMEPLQCVGAMLDASARVYAFRVDNTHCEAYNVRTNFDEAKKKNIREDVSDDEDEGAEGKATGDDGDDDEEADGDGDVAADGGAANGADGEKAKKKKKGLKQGAQDAELNGRLDELNRQSVKLMSRFVKHVLPAVDIPAQAGEPLSADALLEGFEHYASRMQDVVMTRRVGVPFIEQKLNGLNRAVEEFSIDDPIYHKVAKQFEEGCAQSFVNNEVLTNRDGSLLILHTNWRTDDPFGTHNKPLADELVGRPNNAQLFTSIEGSLVRALSSSPSNLPLLQEFCEDDEDGRKVNETAEADNSGVRQLGRKSQDAARASDSVTVVGTRTSAANSQVSAGRHSGNGAATPTENGDEQESESSMSLTEEEREQREHEELAKFQMYLDEDVDMKSEPLRDPFDNLSFFPDNFAYLTASESMAAAGADTEKAVLHQLSEADANALGVSLSVLSEIKSVMKPGRAVPAALLTRLSLSLAPAKLAQFRMLVDVDALGAVGAADDVFNASMSNFLVTRFAPLIDSIWHSVIKSADEEDLARANVFVGGVRNAQRALNRQLQHQAHLQRSASKRRRAQAGPPTPTFTATPVRSTRRRPGERPSQDIVVSPPKRQRLGVASASQSIADEEEEGDNEFGYTQTSEFTQSPAARLIKERIYFWARPRRYPIVYLGQIMDDRDGPMKHGVEMFVDMEEMLLGMDEGNRLSQIDEDVVEETAPPESVKAELGDEIRLSATATDTSLTAANDEGLEEFGDYLAADGDDEPPAELLFDQPPTPADGDQLADILNDAIIGNDFPENTELGDAERNVLREPTPDDQSHWKGGAAAAAEDGQPIAAVEAPAKEKKTRKKPANKAKRRRLISDLNAEMGGSLTGELLWQTIDDMEPTVTTSIARHQSNVDDASDLVHKIDGHRRANEPKLFLDRRDFALDFSGQYEPLQLIKSSLFFDNHFGFWRFEKKKDEKSEAKFYERPCKHETPSMDDQSNEFLALFFRDRMPSPAVKSADEPAPVDDHYTNFDPYNLDAPASPRGVAFDDDDASGGDSDGELGGLARLDEPPLADGDVDMKLISVPNAELKQEEQLEFNGGIIKIRQSRVKAPLVKRAIAFILSSNEMDFKSLSNMRSMYTSKRRSRRNSDKENRSGEANPDAAEPTGGDCAEIVIGDNDSDGMSSDEEEDIKMASQSSSSSSEDEEEVLSANPAPNVSGVTQTLNTTAATDGFAVRGEHTFESLLTNLPQHLSGRTKHDLNVINAFAITLHICNEQQMHLLQDKDEETLLVTPKAMSSFKFQLSNH